MLNNTEVILLFLSAEKKDIVMGLVHSFLLWQFTCRYDAWLELYICTTKILHELASSFIWIVANWIRPYIPIDLGSFYTHDCSLIAVELFVFL